LEYEITTIAEGIGDDRGKKRERKRILKPPDPPQPDSGTLTVKLHGYWRFFVGSRMFQVTHGGVISF
jgi:hypothetical protein